MGKTTLSKQICESYGLMYVSLDVVAKDIMDDLVSVSHFVFNSSSTASGIE